MNDSSLGKFSADFRNYLIEIYKDEQVINIKGDPTVLYGYVLKSH